MIAVGVSECGGAGVEGWEWVGGGVEESSGGGERGSGGGEVDWEGWWWKVLSSWVCGLERSYALSVACCEERKNQAAYRWAVIAHARYPLLWWRG